MDVFFLKHGVCVWWDVKPFTTELWSCCFASVFPVNYRIFSWDLIISNCRLSCLISNAAGPSFVEQWLVLVDAAFFSVVVKSEISVALFPDTGDRTVRLWFLLYNSLRLVCGTGVQQIVLCLAHFWWHQTHCHQWNYNVKTLDYKVSTVFVKNKHYCLLHYWFLIM